MAEVEQLEYLSEKLLSTFNELEETNHKIMLLKDEEVELERMVKLQVSEDGKDIIGNLLSGKNIRFSAQPNIVEDGIERFDQAIEANKSELLSLPGAVLYRGGKHETDEQGRFTFNKDIKTELAFKTLGIDWDEIEGGKITVAEQSLDKFYKYSGIDGVLRDTEAKFQETEGKLIIGNPRSAHYNNASMPYILNAHVIEHEVDKYGYCIVTDVESQQKWIDLVHSRDLVLDARCSNTLLAHTAGDVGIGYIEKLSEYHNLNSKTINPQGNVLVLEFSNAEAAQAFVILPIEASFRTRSRAETKIVTDKNFFGQVKSVYAMVSYTDGERMFSCSKQPEGATNMFRVDTNLLKQPDKQLVIALKAKSAEFNLYAAEDTLDALATELARQMKKIDNFHEQRRATAKQNAVGVRNDNTVQIENGGVSRVRAENIAQSNGKGGAGS